LPVISTSSCPERARSDQEYVNPPVRVPEPAGDTTTTFAAPTDPAGVVTVIEVSLTTAKAVPAVPPKEQDVAPENPQPVTVTALPPRWEPDAGETLDT
jgi:hypothetical protein